MANVRIYKWGNNHTTRIDSYTAGVTFSRGTEMERQGIQADGVAFRGWDVRPRPDQKDARNADYHRKRDAVIRKSTVRYVIHTPRYGSIDGRTGSFCR